MLAAAESASVRRVYEAQPNRAKARNAGIAAARGELIIFCDDDTVAPEGFVAAHVAAHAAAPNSVVSGPIINVPDEAHLVEAKPPPLFARIFLHLQCQRQPGRASRRGWV